MFGFEQSIKFDNKSNDVLAVGELLIDLISEDYDDTLNGTVYHRFFGGSPANIAMNARKLGIRTQVAAAIGKDRMGGFLIDQLCNAGINPIVQRVEQSTSMVLLTKSKSSPIPVFYRGADPSDHDDSKP